MKRFGKKILTLTLCAGLCLGLTPAFATESPTLYNFEKSKGYTDGLFADVPADAWYATGIETSYRLGLLNGKGENSFDPTGNITVIETITLAARLRKTYYEGSATFESSDPWYQVYWDYAVKNGIITQNQFTSITAPATRAVFAQILANALPDEALEVKNLVDSGMIPDVPAGASYEAAVYKLYRAGILTGSDSAGSFYPENTIIRAEVAAIAARMAVESERKTVTLTADATLQQFDRIYPDSRVVVDGVVTLCELLEKNGKWYLSAADAKAVLGNTVSGDFVELDGYAKAQNIRYQQDTVMTAAYFSTYLGYDGTAGKTDFDRAIELGLADASWASKKSEALTSTQFRSILAYFIRQVAPDKLNQFYANVTDREQTIDRETGFIMAFYAAQCVGADYCNYSLTEDIANLSGDYMYLWSGAVKELFPHIEEPTYCGFSDQPVEETQWDDGVIAGCVWAVSYQSPNSGALVFDLDREAFSMRDKEPLTVEDGINAVMRMYDGISTVETVSVTDALATTPDKSILTDTLLAKATTAPAVTANNHPEWTGVVLNGAEYTGDFHNAVDLFYGGTANCIRTMADWGFNSVRLNIDYEALFNTDVTQAKAEALQELDRFVAAAIQNSLHLNLCFTTLPARTMHHSTEDYTSVGAFDLYINESKWATANRLLEVIAQRYKDIPNAYLSFTPTWEINNLNLSSGLEAPSYTGADVGNYILSAIDAIRAVDPDRLIIAENISVHNGGMSDSEQVFAGALASALSQRSNILTNFNFATDEYIYACMTDTAGENIDHNNHSFYLVHYPTDWYALSPTISGTEQPLRLEGSLPKGTTVELFVSDSSGGQFTATADGTAVYTEALSNGSYRSDIRTSVYIGYAETERCISFTLNRATTVLELSAPNGSLSWRGLKLTLPEEYAVEKWYYTSGYDVYLGLEAQEEITRRTSRKLLLWSAEGADDFPHTAYLHSDLTFTSDRLLCHADREAVSETLASLNRFSPNCLIRFENATFGATTQSNLLRYYEDTLSGLTEQGMSWWDNDWEALAGQKQYAIADGEYADYNGTCETIYPALLRLLQKYQNIER